MTRRIALAPTRREALCLPLLAWTPPATQARRWRAEETRRFDAPEAAQAVAVDSGHFYAIGNHVIAKYGKQSGKRQLRWQCEQGKPLIHLNSGVVRDGVLYCAHSNYPGVPMLSSIEMWETRTLRHAGSHSFGISDGSATWLDFHAGHRYVTFAHYGNRAAEPGRDARWTTLIQFDLRWRRRQAWAFPDEVIAKQGQYSISGGVFGPGGVMFCSGHDHPEIYALRFPEGGSTLVLEDTFAVPVQGQGIAWDTSSPGTLYGIDRRARQVVEMRVRAA